ncbi:MAG: hypothetical protein KBT04_07650, partial [Bacteroidales bacterium]|nr:hypothetical protein [Candidatus Colimorpha onthohippi]
MGRRRTQQHHAVYHRASAGRYTYTLYVTTKKGDLVCRSNSATRTVTVRPNAQNEISATVCDQYNNSGMVIGESCDTSYVIRHASVTGCDSTVTLHLTVKQSTPQLSFSKSLMSDAIDSFPYTMHYTVNGVAQQHVFGDFGSNLTHYTNSVGCDSSILLVLSPYPDNLTTTTCDLVATEPAMEWKWKEAWISKREVSSFIIPLVGDLNGDGLNEIVCFEASDQSVLLSTGSGANYVAPTSGERKVLVFTQTNAGKCDFELYRTFTLPGIVDAYGPTPYGILRVPNDDFSDTTGLIIFAKRQSMDYVMGFSQNAIVAYDMDGNKVWESNIFANGESTTNTEKIGQSTIGFADFNNDGHPEVYVRNKVFDAATGRLLAEAPTHNTASSWAYRVSNSYYFGSNEKDNGYLSFPFATNLTGDDRPELLLGGEVYEVTITNRQGTAGNGMKCVARSSAACAAQNLEGLDGHVAVADFNYDGYTDVLYSARLTSAANAPLYCYVWDVHNNVTGNVLTLTQTANGKSIPAIGDLDGNLSMEMVIQSQNGLAAYTCDPSTLAFSQLWKVAAIDNSYCNGVTLFDFDNEGTLEIVTHTANQLQLRKGTDGTVLLSTSNRIEPTVMTYPIIADVDCDGHAEIITVDTNISQCLQRPYIQKGHLKVIKSDATEWLPARPVWNQYMYNSVNVTNQLTVPAFAMSPAQSILGPVDGNEHHSYYNALGDYLNRTPFNGFLSQAAPTDQFGRPFVYAPDIQIQEVSGLDTVVMNDSMYIKLRYCNLGQDSMPAPFYLTTYRDSVVNGAYEQRDTITRTLMMQKCDSITISMPLTHLCAIRPIENGGTGYEDCEPRARFKDNYNLIFSFNDRGDGVAQNGTDNAGECDTINNQDTLNVTLRPQYTAGNQFDTFCASQAEYVWHNCKHFGRDTLLQYYDETAEYGEFFALDTLPNRLGCDSVVTIKISIFDAQRADTAYHIVCDSLHWNLRKNAGVDELGRTIVVDKDTVFTTDWHVFENIVKNVAFGGVCDSVYTLDVQVYSDTLMDTADYVACSTFTWRGKKFYARSNTSHADGIDLDQNDIIYYDTLRKSDDPNSPDYHAVHGVCDSVFKLYLKLNSDTNFEFSVTVCDGLMWWDNYLDSTDTYYHTSVDAVGSGDPRAVSFCDSNYILHLTVYSDSLIDTATYTACKTFTWRGKTYNLTDEEPYNFAEFHKQTVDDVVKRAVHGVCDSIYRLHLTLNNDSTLAIEENVCDSVYWHNEWHAADGTFEYTDYGTVPGGCDSTFRYTIHVYHNRYADTVKTEVCDYYPWRDTLNHNMLRPMHYDSTGIYGDVVRNAVPSALESSLGGVCDSFYALHVIVHPNALKLEYDTACKEYDWRSHHYTQSGVYSDTLIGKAPVPSSELTFVSELSCDSVYRMNVAIYNDSLIELPVYNAC